MKRKPRVVLFQPRSAKGLREWAPLMEALQHKGYTPAVVIDWACPQEWLDQLDRMSVQRISIGSDESEGRCRDGVGSQAHFLSRLFSRLKRGAAERIPLQLKYFLGTCLTYFRLTRATSRLFTKLRPDIIVLSAGANPFRAIPLKVARNAGIPSLLVPHFYLLNLPSEARIRRQRPDFVDNYSLKPLGNRIAARLVPRLVYEVDGVSVLRYPGGQALAARILGIMPADPWGSLGADLATRVAVEGERQRRSLLAAGVPKGKIAVTGKPRADILFQQLQLDVRERRVRLGIDPDRRAVLCALPQLAEHGILPWPEHWQEIEFLLATLTSLENVTVVLSLFPASREQDYRLMAEKYGAIIPSNHDLSVLIPLCDIYLANAGSSTIVFAVGCHKPAIAFNFYNLQDDFYAECGGVLVVREKAKLLPLLKHLLTDDETYERLVQLQKQVASDWMMLDGQCRARVVAQIEDLLRTARRTQREKDGDGRCVSDIPRQDEVK